MPASDRPAPPASLPRRTNPVLVDLGSHERRAPHAPDRQDAVLALSTKHSQQKDEAAQSAVRGAKKLANTFGFVAKIDDASLADLVQMECMRGLTRSVRVANDGGQEGVLYFDQGQLVHAEVGTHAFGEDAALEILSWRGGKAEPCPKLWLRPRTIETGWQGLLMVAAARLDESVRAGGHALPVEGRFLDAPGVPTERCGGETRQEPVPAGVLRKVRLDAEGQVLESSGDVGDFSDFSEAVAYTVRLAQLIGEGLGLEEFGGFFCKTPQVRLVAAVRSDGQVVAVEGSALADLSEYEAEAGLER